MCVISCWITRLSCNSPCPCTAFSFHSMARTDLIPSSLAAFAKPPIPAHKCAIPPSVRSALPSAYQSPCLTVKVPVLSSACVSHRMSASPFCNSGTSSPMPQICMSTLWIGRCAAACLVQYPRQLEPVIAIARCMVPECVAGPVCCPSFLHLLIFLLTSGSAHATVNLSLFLWH